MGQGQITVKTLKHKKKKTISMTYWLQLVQKEICIKGGYHKIILLQNSKDSIILVGVSPKHPCFHQILTLEVRLLGGFVLFF